jgi:hypothetical protein
LMNAKLRIEIAKRTTTAISRRRMTYFPMMSS